MVIKCINISKYTGAPEILEGRVKTLHPKIYAGILNKRNNNSHYQDLIKNYKKIKIMNILRIFFSRLLLIIISIFIALVFLEIYVRFYFVIGLN